MNEDTRKLILRLQGEDLAALWTLSIDDNSEIDATLRAYRRQLSLLDRHLEEARQTKTTEGVGGATDCDAMTSVLQITDTDARVKTEDGELRQGEGVCSRHEAPSRFSPPASTPTRLVATTVRSLFEGLDRPVVRLPSSSSVAGDQANRIVQDGNEAGTRDQQVEESCGEAEKQEVTNKTMELFRAPVGSHRQSQPFPFHAQPVKEFSIKDIAKKQDQKKVERIMTIVPGRAVSVIYDALKTCHGSFDNAVDMLFRQEGASIYEGDDDSADNGSHAATFSVQSRTTSKQQVNASTQTIADKCPSDPELSTMATSTAVACNPTSVITKPSPTAATDLKRSADHLAPSNAPPAKKLTSNSIKKEPGINPDSPAQGRTIRDQVDDLLQSSRFQPSPIPRTRGLRRGGHGRAFPPRNNQPRPPERPSYVMRFDTGHHGQ